MTQGTRNLVIKFSKTLDPALVPGIVIGMQEEDNVSNIAPFGGCFRILRNISAHEPYTLVSFMQDENNYNYDTHTLGKGTSTCYLCHYHMLAILYHMFIVTNDVGYIMFAQSFTRVMLPFYFFKNRTFSIKVPSDLNNNELWKIFCKLQDDAALTSNRVRHFNPNDSRLMEILVDNPKLFWKIAIPDITEFALSGIPSSYEILTKEAYQFIINILLLRDQ